MFLCAFSFGYILTEGGEEGDRFELNRKKKLHLAKACNLFTCAVTLCDLHAFWFGWQTFQNEMK